MEKYIIEGGLPLRGEASVHGAKNAALPILAATLLNRKSILHNCPALSDVVAAQNILQYLGCSTKREGNTLIVSSEAPTRCDIPESLMREMRSSIVFLGAIIAKFKKARISFPGGCELGPRPIDIHLSSLEKLGVTIKEDHGYLDCTVEKELRGTHINLPFPSVGATENIMIAASTAKGITTVSNAAREPEISDLADFLNACGAKIRITGEGTVIIEGVPDLHEAQHTVIPDRIVAATYLCAAAATGGNILITDVIPGHLLSVLYVLEEMGCDVKRGKNTIALYSPARLKSVKSIRTMPYPGFPTDAQAPVMVLASLARGSTVFVENIFENRYKHAGELARMGAKIKVEGRVAVVEGVPSLQSATVQSTDLRGGAALVIAGLAAQGRTYITQIHHVERGYEHIDRTMRALGANMMKSSE